MMRSARGSGAGVGGYSMGGRGVLLGLDQPAMSDSDRDRDGDGDAAVFLGKV